MDGRHEGLPNEDRDAQTSAKQQRPNEVKRITSKLDSSDRQVRRQSFPLLLRQVNLNNSLQTDKSSLKENWSRCALLL